MYVSDEEVNASDPMLNALTVDVEDYFQVNAFADFVRREDWSAYPLRVEANTHRVLEILGGLEIHATFFILGWVAERCPNLIKEIYRRGHEIASHGYGHELIYQIGPERFREDIRRAKRLLEDLTGVPVDGYRAPSYSITNRSLWAFDILVEEGFRYDSSIFPVVHDTYGIPDAPRFPHLRNTDSGTIREFPLTTWSLPLCKKARLPVAGGGYLRLFPAAFLKHAISSVNGREHEPAVLYFHPWEIDPEQPRINAGYKSRFRHYLNLDKTEKRLVKILSALHFGTMRDVLKKRMPPIMDDRPLM